MNDFIRVLGDDPDYKGRKTHCFIHRNSISRVHPVNAVVTNGRAWLCTNNHPGGQIISYTLIDLHGREYSCGSSEELAKLGIIFGKNESAGAKSKARIGFVSGENNLHKELDTEMELPGSEGR